MSEKTHKILKDPHPQMPGDPSAVQTYCSGLTTYFVRGEEITTRLWSKTTCKRCLARKPKT